MAAFKSPRPCIVLMALCVLGLVIYGRALAYPFVHDDVVYILNNPFIGRWDDLPALFFQPTLLFDHLQTPYYRPLLEVIYRLEHLIFGMNAWGFHLINILLHAVNAWLFYLCARHLRLSKGWALFIAALFLAHPLQSEAVTCISGISNLAVAFFILSAFLVYVRVRKSGRVWAWGAMGLFTLALLAKEQAVVFAGIIGLYEVLYHRGKIGGRIMAFLSFAVITLVFLAWRSFLFPASFAEAFANTYELKLRLLSMARIILTDLKLMVWPTDLHYYRSVDMLAPYLACWVVLGGIMVLAGVLIVRAPGALRRRIIFSLGMAALTVLPGLNIFPLINEYSFLLAAEHFLYLPLAGILLAAGFHGAGLTRHARPKTRRGLIAIACFIVVVCGIITMRQSGYWKSERVLFERAVAFEPGQGRVWMLLARANMAEGRLPQAEAAYDETLRIMQNYVKKTGHSPAGVLYRKIMKAAYFDRAQCRFMQGDVSGAADDYEALLALAAEGISADEFGVSDATAVNNLGFCRARLNGGAAVEKNPKEVR